MKIIFDKADWDLQNKGLYTITWSDYDHSAVKVHGALILLAFVGVILLGLIDLAMALVIPIAVLFVLLLLNSYVRLASEFKQATMNAAARAGYEFKTRREREQTS